MTQPSIEQNQNIEITHPLFELKATQEMKMSLSDKVLSMSQEAQVMLMKLGIEWQRTTGYSSWVAKGLLVSLLKIPDDAWTINKLSKYSGYGRAGIEYALVPFMQHVGMLEHQTLRFKKYFLTEHGRETLESMVYNCIPCNNTRKCQKCETGVALTERYCEDPAEPCDHVIRAECNDCQSTGFRPCQRCDGTGQRDDWNGHTVECNTCIGNGNELGKMNCHNCVEICNECVDNTRVCKCFACHGHMECRECKETLEKLTYNKTIYDDDDD